MALLCIYLTDRQTDTHTDTHEIKKTQQKTSNTGFGGIRSANLISGDHGTDSHSTFFLIFSLCFFWYHTQDVPTFHQADGTSHFLFKRYPARGRELRPSATREQNHARHPLRAGLLWLVPQSLGLQVQLQLQQQEQQQPWQGLGNLSPASSARPRGVCFSHGPRVGAVGTR